ncbi:DNA adenine methylase [Megasphaera vaginalis (ex Srinivasan et al. 2021)]|uniref:site-specific DNA-methyltransferase (adenine-specific) n=1 Tax=Megasphaera vaginalis (ex Srinivasan et al. 2021) TaxID=1111454 RepID=U7UN91_9FIRM|nr:DNA adenine methylase [Megasphaera vaginalis (ex Srinivasan et al. 2021)]ERT60780.1 D12 class N6 adenine-specific DNA methyltransferase [Megasphaera vaginalis (ex Srinivasan et al. 2021)]
MPRTKSILRYPGGKTQLAKFVEHLIHLNNLNSPIYCEPFSGGSGVSMELLLSNKVDSIILNDYDVAIYSVWYAVLHESERLIHDILTTPITMTEWINQKSIYDKLRENQTYDYRLAFSTLFLNRTNRAGIITGGPIGGYEQNSKYKLNCRFNKDALAKKVADISAQRDRIRLYMLDAKELIHNVLLNISPKYLFTFFDPPYYTQGQLLYKNSFKHDDHVFLYNAIREMDLYHWITTYDHCDKIAEIYSDLPTHTYTLQYSARITRKEKEYLYSSPNTQIESFDKVILQ